MEMIFCFCQKCLDEIDRANREADSLPDYLNAYSDQLCSNCGRQLKMAGTRKFEVEMLNFQEQDGVHLFTEYAVLRHIAEPTENYKERIAELTKQHTEIVHVIKLLTNGRFHANHLQQQSKEILK